MVLSMKMIKVSDLQEFGSTFFNDPILKLAINAAAANAPAVDAVEVVNGRWLFDSITERYFCSACNEQALYTSRDVPEYDYDWEENLRYSYTETYIEEHLTDYCPNCGAKMDLERKDNEETD